MAKLRAALVTPLFAAAVAVAEQPAGSAFHVDVAMVVLDFRVEAGGKRIDGLRPADVRILEDGIPQKIEAFVVGRKMVLGSETFAGGNVFILFDTSDHMYEGYPHAIDATVKFVRSLDSRDAVALYTFSANLHRTVPLTKDHQAVVSALRSPVAGSHTALYNALLLTVQDAAKAPGRKCVVVFSNGSDNASVASPDDVRRVAEEAGIPIYVVSARDDDAVSRVAFTRLAERTGGEALFSSDWMAQRDAFDRIGQELANSYTVAYYPQPNPNSGFRRIRVELLPEQLKQFQIRARPGYKP